MDMVTLPQAPFVFSGALVLTCGELRPPRDQAA
jgi:hypothetical protein